jgi:adenylyltransferase/sulfurtransferase
VELSNLQRQIIFNSADLGEEKSLVAKDKLLNLNENIICNSHTERVNENNINDLLEGSDCVIDCSDNFETRKAINKYCFETKKNLISGACVGWQGQIFIFRFSRKDSPCYECLFEGIEEEDLSCRESSIFSPLAGLIGTYLAIEAIKNILELNYSEDNFIEINSLNNEIKKRKIIKNSFCKICSN